MAKKLIKKENKADNVSVTGVETKEADIISIMEKAVIQNPFVQKPKVQGGRCAIEEKPSEAAGEFEINNRELPTLDKAGTHNPSVQKAKSQVAQTDRCAIEKKPSEAAGEFKNNNRGLPTLDLEQYEHNIKEETGIADNNTGSICYGWIGAGECGGELVKSFYDLGYRKVLAVNTTRRDLDLLAIPQSQKLFMDIREGINERDMERDVKNVQQHRQDILRIAQQTFGTQVNHLMICFGAGGGAGNGSVVELIEIAKGYARFIGHKNPSKSVGVIMTLPASGKIGSPLAAQNTCKLANKLSQMANAGEISPLIIVDNDKISKMYPKMATRTLRVSINRTVAGLFDFFNKVSALGSPYTSFDRLDYLDVIESGGCLVMGRTKVDKLEDPFSISEAVKNNLDRTLFAGGLDLSTVKSCGCIVVGGKELMAKVKGLQEKIDYAFHILSEMTGEATIHRGIYEDNNDSLRVFTIIGGLKSPTERLDKLSTDLYFRPDVFETDGLQLREQRKDILSLAEYFLSKEADFYNREDKILNSDTKKLLLHYSWPGNIRELAKAMGRAHELTVGRVIHPDALPYNIIFADSKNYPKHIQPIVDKAQRRIIVKTLELFHGRKSSVARILGIEPQRLNHLIKKLNISIVKINASS